MDLETPVDAWYIWLGVAIVSLALAGVALSIPSEPPPNATRAANTIDDVAGSTYRAHATYEHGADDIRIDTKRIAMRNDGGTADASIAFGSLTPVDAVDDDTKREALERILHGEHPTAVVDEYGLIDESDLTAAAATARAEIDQNGAEWRPADGVLRVRQLQIGNGTVVLIDG